MGITHLSGLAVSGVPTMGTAGLPGTSGAVYFVSSTRGSNGNAGTSDSPLATLAAAYALCNADAGDTVVLQAGHAETVSVAGGITLATSGVTVVGWGSGSNRPTFTFGTATSATFIISGNNNSVTNIVGVCNIDQIVSPFVVSGADVTLGVEWRDASTVKEALRAVLTTATADRLTLNLNYIGFTGGSHVVNAVRLVGTDNANLNVNFYGVLTTAAVEFVTTAATNVNINLNAYISGIATLARNVVDTVTGSTWTVQGYDAIAGGAFDASSSRGLASSGAAVQEAVASSATAVMVTGNTIFTVAGGPIEIQALVSLCISNNDTTASTLLYAVTPSVGAGPTNISGASASLASATAGASVALAGTALATAALLSANGPNLMANPATIFCPAGAIKVTIGVGSTTGTWKHYIRYKPLAPGVTVV